MRRPRNELPPHGVYHVTTRGVARTATFRDADDYLLFLRFLARQVERHGWHVLAFSLMPNHYHLVVETELWRLSDGLQRLNGTYAQAFNRRHNRWGHLFGDRFASWVVEATATSQPRSSTSSRTPSAPTSPTTPVTTRGPPKRTLVRSPHPG